jgi:hypothetical protein
VNATCRYDTVPGVAYSSMPYTFSVTGGTAHSTPLVGLQSSTTYNYSVRCADTSGNMDTTDYPVSFSIAAPTVSSGPSLLSVTPNSGSGATQAFAFQISDSGGYADFQQLAVVFNTAVGLTNSCVVEYSPATNSLYLQSNDTTTWSQATLGSSTILSNSQCSVSAAASSVSANGTAINATFAMSFASAWSGTKSIFAYASGVSASTGWQTMGSWTVPAPVVSGTPPTVALSPNSGSGSSATFSLGVTDAGGAGNVLQGALFIGALGATNGCYIDYQATTNVISLQSDTGTAWPSATVGSSTVLQNSQCSINAGLVTVSQSGNTLTLKVPVAFTTSYQGTQALTSFGANKTGQSSGWVSGGTWTVSFTARKKRH